MFVLTTLDRQEGLVEIVAAAGAEDDLCSILHELSDEIGIQCSKWGGRAE